MMDTPDITNIHTADLTALREAFAMLVDRSADIVDPLTFETMDDRTRRRVLLKVCAKLADDAGMMPEATCDALDLLPGKTFAVGAERAKLVAQVKEAAHGERS